MLWTMYSHGINCYYNLDNCSAEILSDLQKLQSKDTISWSVPLEGHR